MDDTDPYAPRILVTDDEFGGFRVQISRPPETAWWCAWWMMIWLCVGIPVCLFGFLLMIAGWGIIGTILILGIALNALGWEVFQIIEKQVRIRRGVGTWVAYARDFDLSAVRNLRIAGVAGYEQLTLEHNCVRYCIGNGLSLTNQCRLMTTIRSRCTIPEEDQSSKFAPFPIQR